MFKKRTLFVVGAGASKEFDIPLGADLASLIAKKTSVKDTDWGHDPKMGDEDILSQLAFRDRERLHLFLNAAKIISSGIQFSHSIDDFLDNHSANEDVRIVGKIAIAKTILEKERASKLWFSKSNIHNKMDVSRFEDTWLIKFVRLLGRNIQKEAIENIFDNVAFIVFNYDRCIEQCLYHALQQLYDIKPRDAANLVSKLTIIHPYGKVGELETEAAPNGVPFGGRHERLSEGYSEISNGIQTYTEQIKDKIQLAVLRSQMDEAEQIVFLGFAFHEQNLNLLKSKEKLDAKKVYGTAFGMSDSDVSLIQEQLKGFFSFEDDEDDDPFLLTPRPFFSKEFSFEQEYLDIRNDLTCAKFFDQYGRSLIG
ncbi:MAG: hypothetical protein KF794_07745 [Xanthobacteraceae bacterium]|nr:hypothetical protein [Xanthobacteraceae bacterium]QYK43709.1 MAG: hypothetical protein KF794_07745 [Xanthobacteraceae bacterium]